MLNHNHSVEAIWVRKVGVWRIEIEIVRVGVGLVAAGWMPCTGCEQDVLRRPLLLVVG